MTDHVITPTLHVSPRTDIKTGELRRQGLVPVELYGHKVDNKHYQVELKALTALMRAFGTTSLIDVVTEDGKAPVKVLFKEPQYHPLSHNILHLDLHQVNLKEKITAEVPLSFVGVAPAVDLLGGTLIESKQHIEVECLPSDLPHEIEVDITPLATFEDTLHIKNIVIPAGVEILDDPEDTIATIAEPRSDEELAALDEVIADVNVEEAVAVEEKGKADEEGSEEEGSDDKGKEKSAEKAAE